MADPRIKSRGIKDGGHSVASYSYGTPSTSRSFSIFTDIQRTFSENHPGYRRLDANRDNGGDFDSYRIRIPASGMPWSARYNYSPSFNAWQNEASVWLVASSDISAYSTNNGLTLATDASIASFLSSRVPPGEGASTLSAMGTKAIDMVKPTNPSVDMATALAELYAERKFFSVPGKGGGPEGEYLNYQFGIAPTVSTVQDLRDTIENRDPIIRQYQRDSERVIRRQYRFDSETTTTTTRSSQGCACIGVSLNTFMNPGGTLTKTTKTTRQFWFSGAFKYSIPKESFPRRMSELDRLYGVKPGVSTGWELLPFSWLVDYFSPVGGILSNMDAFLQDGLVMPYAYIMCTTEVVDTYNWRGPLRDSAGVLTPVEVETQVYKTRLQRRRASPFGFGLLAGDLNPKQLSILAALGLSMRK